MSQAGAGREQAVETYPREDAMLITIIIIALAVIGLLALFGVLRSRA
jgi:hypothetical protein